MFRLNLPIRQKNSLAMLSLTLLQNGGLYHEMRHFLHLLLRAGILFELFFLSLDRLYIDEFNRSWPALSDYIGLFQQSNNYLSCSVDGQQQYQPFVALLSGLDCSHIAKFKMDC